MSYAEQARNEWEGPISLREVLIELGIAPTVANLRRAAAAVREQAARDGLEVRTIEVRPGDGAGEAPG